MLAVVEVDPHQALRTVGQLDGGVELDNTASKRRACSVALVVSSRPPIPLGKPR